MGVVRPKKGKKLGSLQVLGFRLQKDSDDVCIHGLPTVVPFRKARPEVARCRRHRRGGRGPRNWIGTWAQPGAFWCSFFGFPFFSPPRIRGGGSLQRTSRPRLHVLLRKEDSGEINARNRQVRNRSMLTHAPQPRQFRWALFWGYPFGKPTEHV